MKMSGCVSCAWFCHSDRKCYGADFKGQELCRATYETGCGKWTADGLSDEEREELDALVTVEEA